MEILQAKMKLNYPALKRYITKVAAQEFSKLVEPCYYPKTKIFYFEVLALLGLKNKDVKEFVKRNYKGTKAEKGFVLWKDVGTNLLVFVMHLFLKKRDKAAFASTILYYMIIHYSRLMHKQMKYCNVDTFRYTLDNLTRTHLFFREKNIPGSLFYLSKQMINRFTDDIREWDKEGLISFIGVSRHRISQSVKSFAESYYRYGKQGAIIKTQNEEPDAEGNIRPQPQAFEKGQRIVDKVTKKITTYRVFDRKAFEEARKISKVKTSVATIVADNLTNAKYFNNVKIALQLFVKDIRDVDMICGDGFYGYVKSLMAVKRTKAQLYFKAQVNILLRQVLKDVNYLETYNKYTSQTQFIISTFLALYITLVMRNTLC